MASFFQLEKSEKNVILSRTMWYGFSSLCAISFFFAAASLIQAEEGPRILLQPEGEAVSKACDFLGRPVVAQSLPSLTHLELSRTFADFFKENPHPDAGQISQRFQIFLIEHGYPHATVEVGEALSPSGRLILKVNLGDPSPPPMYDFSTPLITQSIDWKKETSHELSTLTTSSMTLTDIDDEIRRNLSPVPSTPSIQYKVQNSQNVWKTTSSKLEATWVNPSYSGQNFSYSFTPDPNNENALSHGAGTSIHLPWGHDLDANVWQWQSEVEQANDWSWKGEGIGSGLDYKMPLPKLGPVQHSLQASLNYSRNASSSRTDASDVSSQTLETDELTLAWNPSLQYASGRNWMNISSVWSPGNLSPDNSDSSFATANSGTDSNYRIFRLEAGRDTPLPDGFSLNTKMKVQMADTSLTTGALAPLDDYSSYHIGSISGDEGYTAAGELCLPKINLGSLPVNGDEMKDFQIFAFSSYGSFYNKTPQGSLPEGRLLSFGPGATIRNSDKLSFQFAYGWQFEDQKNNSNEASSDGSWANASMKLDF